MLRLDRHNGKKANMSIQFGRWTLENRPLDPDCIREVGAMLAPYGNDSNESYSTEDIQIIYRAFHTTKESHTEIQPHISSTGAVMLWDGRLDNRAELVADLQFGVNIASSDVVIVAAAYSKWGAKSFAKLIGDWALSIWNPHERFLLLAKDPIGTRHLYYTVDAKQITWCTILDPLVRLAAKPFGLDEEYIAGWVSSFPAVHLTPYAGIRSVPPSSALIFQSGKQNIRKYWEFDPGLQIRYRHDFEYEEHFRTVFATAVRPRLRADRPLLAELSGGRDSSAIVCMADTIITGGSGDNARLDTLSMYDDSEPNWNERPFFAKVEEKRGRTGWHINVGLPDSRTPSNSGTVVGRFTPTPGYDGRTLPEISKCLASQGNRVVLSGVGGDEVMGGIPTPLPELEDLLVSGRFNLFAHQLKIWALELKEPWLHLLVEAVRDFLPISLVGVPKQMRPAPWLQCKFVKHHQAALNGYLARTKPFGPLPSLQGSLAALEALRRQLAHTALPFEPHFEKRYPYLDRNLLEFMFAIPREQLVRPTQRRSLMRRALLGIVPDEILNRRGKAFVARAPLAAISTDWINFVQMTQHMLSSSLGIVDAESFSSFLHKARQGESVPLVSLLRTIAVERWLRSLNEFGTIRRGSSGDRGLQWQAATLQAPDGFKRGHGCSDPRPGM
jgi:asparagine synthase (glutamine-hydrolysing)